MLGSVHDAEDLVQETYLRAWRAYHGFENRSSLRTWMYQIATNACLSALEQQAPADRCRPGWASRAADRRRAGDRARRCPGWSRCPTAVVWRHGRRTRRRGRVRESVRLAFVAALQHLTPPQRAVLILRDVLAWQRQ